MSDGGPMERLCEVCADPTTMSVIAQRMADGEALKAIAKSWQVPYGPLLEWIADDEERAGKYRRAKAFGAIHEVDEAKEIADGATPETILVDKERIRVRQFRASRLAREEYGERAEVRLEVEDKRPALSHDALVLEVGRKLSYMLHRAATVAGEARVVPALPAPIDITPTKEEKNAGDAGVI